MIPVVVLPAMGVPASHYGRFRDALAAHGLAVRVVDLAVADPRRAPDTGYHELVEGPVAAAVTVARAEADGAPVVLVGHSLGGQLALLHAAVHREDVAAVALTAAGTVHWRAFPARQAMTFVGVTQAAAVTATAVGHWPGHRLGFGGHQPRRLITDWARTARTGRFRPAGAPDRYEACLSDLDLPTLSVSVTGDTYAPRSAADALLARTGIRAPEHVRVEGSGSTGLVEHVGWLRAPAAVATAVASWLPPTP